MRKTILVIISNLLVIGLTGCAVYGGNRAMYVKSDNATIFGGWGYSHLGKGSSLLIWDNSFSSNIKSLKDFPGYMPVPQIQVDPNSNLNIGKPSKYPPSEVKPETRVPGSMESLASSTTGSLPLPK